MRRLSWNQALVIAIALLWGWGSVSAQQPPSQTESSSKNQQAASSTKKSPTDSAAQSASASANKDDQNAAAPSPAGQGQGTEQPQIKSLGRAVALPAGRVSPLQWGPIYVQSAEALQIADFDHFSSTTGGTGLLPSSGATNNNATLFQGSIVYDQNIKRGRLAVQYMPQFILFNGRPLSNATNHTASIDTSFQLSPRLHLSLSDLYYYYSDTGIVLSDLVLQSDIGSGTTLPSQFLQGPGHYLMNTSIVSLDYQMTYRSRISFSGHDDIVSTQAIQRVVARNTYGGEVAYSYLLGPGDSIGGYVSVTHVSFSRLLPPGIYQGMGVNYAKQLGKGFRFSGTLGATTGTPTPGLPRAWLLTGVLSVVKEFQRSSIALSYYRGIDDTVHVASTFSDRLDVSYLRSLSPRVAFSIGGGHYRQVPGSTNITNTNATGTYGAAQLTIRLTPSVKFLTNYGYVQQARGGDILFSGNRHFLSAGIRWETERTPR